MFKWLRWLDNRLTYVVVNELNKLSYNARLWSGSNKPSTGRLIKDLELYNTASPTLLKWLQDRLMDKGCSDRTREIIWLASIRRKYLTEDDISTIKSSDPDLFNYRQVELHINVFEDISISRMIYLSMWGD